MCVLQVQRIFYIVVKKLEHNIAHRLDDKLKFPSEMGHDLLTLLQCPEKSFFGVTLSLMSTKTTFGSQIIQKLKKIRHLIGVLTVKIST